MLQVRKIDRTTWSWGVWSSKKKEFIFICNTEKEAKKWLKKRKKQEME